MPSPPQPSPISSLLRKSTARLRRAPDAAFTTRSLSCVRRSAMAESPFSWRSAERMHRPYCRGEAEHQCNRGRHSLSPLLGLGTPLGALPPTLILGTEGPGFTHSETDCKGPIPVPKPRCRPGKQDFRNGLSIHTKRMQVKGLRSSPKPSSPAPSLHKGRNGREPAAGRDTDRQPLGRHTWQGAQSL